MPEAVRPPAAIAIEIIDHKTAAAMFSISPNRFRDEAKRMNLQPVPWHKGHYFRAVVEAALEQVAEQQVHAIAVEVSADHADGTSRRVASAAGSPPESRRTVASGPFQIGGR